MRDLFLLNIILGFLWAAVSGFYTFPSFLFGFTLGALLLWLVREQVGSVSHLGRTRRVLALTWLFFVELVKSAIQVAFLALRAPNRRYVPLNPGIIAYPLDLDNNAEITLLANLITLTPGTLSVDVSSDKKNLYIHAIDASDKDGLVRGIAEGFEKKIKEAFE